MVFKLNLGKIQARKKGMPDGKLGRIHAEFLFSTSDFRFTKGKDRSVYAFCMTVPKPVEQIRILNLGAGSVTTVSLIGSDVKLKWKQGNDALVISFPEKMNFKYSLCFKVSNG